MPILLHGTTRHRAERIVATRPDPTAGEQAYEPEEFSMCRVGCCPHFGTPEMYAIRKSEPVPG